jgi:hypothetical protein
MGCLFKGQPIFGTLWMVSAAAEIFGLVDQTPALD